MSAWALPAPANPVVSVQEVNNSLNYLLKVMPVRMAEAFNGKIIIRPVELSATANFHGRSIKEKIHALSSYQKWNDRWIINIDSKAKAACSKTDCDVNLNKLILHQLAHIYDDMNILIPINKSEKDTINFRKAAGYFKTGQVPQQCQIVNKLKKSFSDHPDFVKESMLMMTLWNLDPDFSCKNPSMADYFEKRIGPVSNKQRKCNIDFNIPHIGMDFSNEEPLNLNPDKIYRVDYLIAAAGQDLESSQGHAMFRFVICSPERPEVSEKCLQDTEFHITAAFAAFQAGDGDAANIKGKVKGLIGSYPSVLGIQNLFETTKQYNELEDRALVAYPLKLSKREIRNFALQTIETYWNHNQNYYFLNNNCATEGLSLISRSLNRPFNKIFNTDIKILSPSRLLTVLQKANLINYTLDKSDPAEEYPKKIYNPDTNKDRYVNYFPSSAEIAIEKLNEEEKKFWQYKSGELKRAFDRLATTPEKSHEYAARFRVIEQTRLKRLKQKFGLWMQSQITTASESDLKEQGLYIESEVLSLLKKLRLRQDLTADNNSSSSGVPINNELHQSLSDLQSAQAGLKEQFELLNKKLEERNIDFKAKFDEQKECDLAVQNLDFYNKIVSDYFR